MTTESTQPGPTSPDSPPPPTRQALTADSPGFQTPSRPQSPPQDPMDPEATSTRSLADGEIDYVGDSGSGLPPLSSKTATIGPSQVFTADAQAFEGLIGTAVMVAGTVVDSKMSPNTHTWLPTEGEIDSIAGPMSRIAARHAPAVGGGETNDILDGLEAGLGVMGYVLRARTDTIRHAQAEHQGAQNRAGME